MVFVTLWQGIWMLLSLLSVAETFYFLDVSVDTYLMGFIGCKNDGKDSWYVDVFELMIISRLNFFFLLNQPSYCPFLNGS